MAADEPDAREHPRSNVFLGAALYIGGELLPVRVRNLSTVGALLEGPGLPTEGIEVELRRGALKAAGEIAWTRDSYRGVRFFEPINVGAWVKPTGHPGQQQVDLAIAAVRQGTSAPLASTTQKSPAGPTLETLSRQIQEVSERIAALPNLSIELGEQLLQLDSISQSLLRIAQRKP